MKKIVMTVILSLLSLSVFAQRFTVSTNLVDWANYGTVNVELGYSVSQHISLVAGGKFNGWDFSNTEHIVYNKNIVGYAGFRYWPWYVNSGLWLQFKGQYADYHITGTWRHALDEGRAAGAGLALGYTFMLSKHFNIEVGAGGWGGYLIEHNVYETPRSRILRPDDSGSRAFIDLDNVSVALVFVF